MSSPPSPEIQRATSVTISTVATGDANANTAGAMSRRKPLSPTASIRGPVASPTSLPTSPEGGRAPFMASSDMLSGAVGLFNRRLSDMPSPEIGRVMPRANSGATFGDNGPEVIGPREQPNSPEAIGPREQPNPPEASAFRYEERERNPSIQTVPSGPVPGPHPGASELPAQNTGPANIPSPRKDHVELYGMREDGIQQGLSDRSSSRADSPKGISPETTRYFGVSRSRGFWYKVFVTCVIMVIVVIVTVSIVAARCSYGRCNKHTPPPPAPFPGIAPGSGFIALDVGVNSTQINAYAQHGDGSIRRFEYMDGNWTAVTGDDVVTLVVGGARPSTPLMALAYTHEDEHVWHVFYIGADGTYQDAVNSDKAPGWNPGFLGRGGYKANKSNNTGLTACFAPTWYGYPYDVTQPGIRLYMGLEDTVQEFYWTFGQTAWGLGSNFSGLNPASGVECTGRNASVINLWGQSRDGGGTSGPNSLPAAGAPLAHYWFDFDSVTNSQAHPARQWVKSNVSYPGLNDPTSISVITTGDDRRVHVSLTNSTAIEILVNGTAETSTLTGELHLVQDSFGVSAVEGTKFGSVVLQTPEKGFDIHVLMQTRTDAAADLSRNLESDGWRVQNLTGIQ